jgi:hypothetical protein
VQVAGQASGRLHDHVPRVARGLHRPDDLGLSGQLGPGGHERGVDHGVPGALALGDARGVLAADPVTGQLGPQRLQRLAGIGDHGQLGAVLVRVERGDVDVHEAHIRVLERGAAAGGEVAVARADADDHVRLGREPVRRGAAGRADCPEVLRVVPVQ